MSQNNNNEDTDNPGGTKSSKAPRKRKRLRFWGVVALAVVATIFGLALLVNIFQRKQEARNPFFRVV